jgi:hypothetical protein
LPSEPYFFAEWRLRRDAALITGSDSEMGQSMAEE